ncbi:uncharacterized protein LOC110958199 [Acanthochromis polyacanthus]|uniref:uncharacterized protein LOC110958199 n=1 Tax=Acanthochromis polyacanthus TaxID=80966 RepID=UPI002234C0F1|nr:uncharacterized protein LOC110958199 [Acanthochromis polyacanthus]
MASTKSSYCSCSWSQWSLWCRLRNFFGMSATIAHKGTNSDGTHKVLFRNKHTFGDCDKSMDWSCNSGDCGSISGSKRAEIYNSFRGPFASELWTEDCCWLIAVNGEDGVVGLTALSLAKRSDTGEPNKSPIFTFLPFLRVPKNCPQTYKMMPFDADGDDVRCRFGSSYAQECSLCSQPAGFDLDENSCKLSHIEADYAGIHTFELVVEDFPKEQVELSYSNGNQPQKLEDKTNTELPLSKLPLQFTLEVTDNAPSCEKGVYIPKLVQPTPIYGAKIHAEVDSAVEIRVKAEVSVSDIEGIVVSGPSGIGQRTNGSEFVITWKPTADDSGEHFSVCFAVESSTLLVFFQSEVRCVMVEVKEKIGKSHVICDESSMTILVEKASFPRLSEDHLQLNDPSNTICSLTSNSTHFIGNFGLNQCGTQIEEDDDYLIFKNEITTYEDQNYQITRKHLLEVQFYCQYPKHGNVWQSYSVHRKNVTVWEKGIGTFTYEFEFYEDDSYKTMIDPYSFPLEVEIGSRLYMKIEATSSLSNTELFVESCTAAPYDNPNYPNPYTIIADGCEVDPTVIVYETDHKNKFLFSMEAFKFIGLYDQVYISCSVVMCEAGNPDTRCSQGCMNFKTSDFRPKRETKVQSGAHFISQGPLRLKRSAENSDSPAIALNLNLVFIAGCVLAAVGMICGVILYKTKTSKVKYQLLPASETF